MRDGSRSHLAHEREDAAEGAHNGTGRCRRGARDRNDLRPEPSKPASAPPNLREPKEPGGTTGQGGGSPYASSCRGLRAPSRHGSGRPHAKSHDQAVGPPIRHDDRDCVRRLLRRKNGGGADRDDDLYLEPVDASTGPGAGRCRSARDRPAREWARRAVLRRHPPRSWSHTRSRSRPRGLPLPSRSSGRRSSILILSVGSDAHGTVA